MGDLWQVISRNFVRHDKLSIVISYKWHLSTVWIPTPKNSLSWTPGPSPTPWWHHRFIKSWLYDLSLKALPLSWDDAHLGLSAWSPDIAAQPYICISVLKYHANTPGLSPTCAGVSLLFRFCPDRPWSTPDEESIQTTLMTSLYSILFHIHLGVYTFGQKRVLLSATSYKSLQWRILFQGNTIPIPAHLSHCSAIGNGFGFTSLS